MILAEIPSPIDLSDNEKDIEVEVSEDRSDTSSTKRLQVFTTEEILAVIPAVDDITEPCNSKFSARTQIKLFEQKPVSNPDLVKLAIRMWIIGIGLAMVSAAADTFFQFRFPTVLIGPLVVQLVAYPFGKLWARIMPNCKLKIWKWTIELNPGPFSPKENVCIFMLANVSTA
jgi:hypothetical protein